MKVDFTDNNSKSRNSLTGDGNVVFSIKARIRALSAALLLLRDKVKRNNLNKISVRKSMLIDIDG